jgi:hypothetical protein
MSGRLCRTGMHGLLVEFTGSTVNYRGMSASPIGGCDVCALKPASTSSRFRPTSRPCAAGFVVVSTKGFGSR